MCGCRDLEREKEKKKERKKEEEGEEEPSLEYVFIVFLFVQSLFLDYMILTLFICCV